MDTNHAGIGRDGVPAFSAVLRSSFGALILALALAVLVANSRASALPTAPSTPALDVNRQAAGCPPNDNNSAIGPSGSRCVAEQVLSTRNYLTPACFDARALVSNAIYRRSECKNASSTQAEATAQTRALVKMNDAGVHGDSAPLGRITPNLQWETIFGRNRIDILRYDRSAPGGSIELVEVKMERAGESKAVTQLDRYVGAFPGGPTEREAVAYNFGPGGYSDKFRILLKSCSVTQRVRIVHHFTVRSTASPGVLLVSNPSETRTQCPTTPNEEVDDERDEPREVPHSTPTDPPVSKPRPGSDSNGNGKDDYWEDFLDGHPELDDLPWPGLPDPVKTGKVSVPAAAAIAVAIAAGICIAATSGTCLAFLAGGATAEAGAAATGAVLSSAFVALAALIGWNLWGDPHIVSRDGLAFDLQAVGEFHLLEAPDDGIDVQARLVPSGTNVSLLGAVATNVNDITVELDGVGLKVDGEPTPLGAGQILDLGDGAAVLRDGAKWAVLWPGFGDRFMMLLEGKNVGFHVPEGINTRGILGNGNGNPKDDLALRDGTLLPADASASTLHGTFADSWRVDSSSSLFTYAAGQSTDTFTDRSFPAQVLTLGDFSEDEVAAGSETCLEAGVVPGPQFENCVFDLLVTGDDRYAAAAAQVTDVLVDPTAHTFDGNGLLAEDFEGAVGANFAATRYRSDPATTRVAGPLFDTPGYQVSARGIGRHQALMLEVDFYAYGQIGADSVQQSVGLKLDNESLGTVAFEAEDGPELTGGLVGTVERVGVNQTANGTPLTHYRVTARLPHAASALDLTFSPKNFRGILGTSLAVDNIRISLDVPVAQKFDIALPLEAPSVQATQAAGAGLIESAGAQDEYRFSLDEPTALVVVPEICFSGLTLTLVNRSTGVRTPTRRTCDGTTTEVLPSGDYQLDVTAARGGAYAFKLFVVPEAEVFDYAFGDVVTDGSLGPGSGNLESIASVDRYRFTVPSGGLSLQYQRVANSVSFRVVDRATGTLVTGGWGSQRFNLGAGDYELEFPGQPTHGAYAFKLFVVPEAEVFDYAFGDVVTDGSLGPGSGNLESIASVDRYRFTVPSGGLSLQYQRVANSVSFRVVDRISGAVLANGWNDQRIDLPVGDYYLEFPGQPTHGAYAFKLMQVPNAQVFDYPLGAVVSNGSLGPGSGNLESIASVDRYRFSVPEGGLLLQYQRVSNSVSFRVVNRVSDVVAATGMSHQQFQLPEGEYNLEFPGQSTHGAYSFKLFVVPDPQVFDYVFGVVVSNGVPVAGAGNLETLASTDRYRFSVPEGGLLLQYQRVSNSVSFRVVDRDSGAVVATGMNHQQIQLPEGDYYLEFPGQDTHGAYSFKLFVVPAPDIFEYVLGDSVSNGTPGPGAGNLETIASIDRYRFAVPVGGLSLQYERLSGTKSFQVINRDTGAVVVSGWGNMRIDLAAGSYEVVFYAQDAGTYGWRLSVV